MLQKLHIQNYAIIDELQITFSPKLNIITGETGAGKSIVMGALSLILGERADTAVLRNNNSKCFVEATFTINNLAIKNFLQINELDNEEELIVRREIAISGKSRAFINDTPTTVQTLKNLANLLVDLHQQFDTLTLGDIDFQRTVLDALANNGSLLQTYQSQYKQWLQACKALENLQQQKISFNKELDYNQFLYDELVELNASENELENIEQELQLLSNTEGIKLALTKAYFELKESEQPIITILKQTINQLNTFSSFSKDLQLTIERLQSTQIELIDIANEIDGINEATQFDAERINSINERIALGYKLLKKHGVQTTNELLEIQNNLAEQLNKVLSIDDAIEQKEKEVKQLHKAAIETAEILSTNRHKQVTPLEQNVNSLLYQVGMPNARFKVVVKETNLNAIGKNEISFLFDGNKSNKFEPIAKVASGGELSRLMLCIKSLVAESIDLPTMIFDEIDTGISGEAAKQVGLIMQGMAKKRQIICITHQPQIAGKADAHYFVFKEIKGDSIHTNIKLLNKIERITAIAKMLSGEQPTAAALENAKEMMVN